jgi:hypothetical protein
VKGYGNNHQYLSYLRYAVIECLDELMLPVYRLRPVYLSILASDKQVDLPLHLSKYRTKILSQVVSNAKSCTVYYQFIVEYKSPGATVNRLYVSLSVVLRTTKRKKLLADFDAQKKGYSSPPPQKNIIG